MLESALALLRERGANALTVDAVLAHSGAPRGSVYHHFPGGREQILVEAARLGGDFITATVGQGGDTPDEIIDRIKAFWKQSLRDSEFTDGCPIAAIIVDGHQTSDEVSAIAREVFVSWTDRLRTAYARSGMSRATAATLASVTLSTIEGAVLQARVLKSVKPIDDAAKVLKQACRAG